MRPRLIGIVLLLSGFASHSARADNFDAIMLRKNVEELIERPQSMTIFSSEQLTNLRDLTRTGHGDIDHELRSQAQIEISITPEARLSVARTRVKAPEASCGATTSWLVRIINQSFITSAINIGPGDGHTEKLLEAAPLSPALRGAAVEYRILDIRAKSPGPVELSLRFNAGPGTTDLGSRSMLPLLILCTKKAFIGKHIDLSTAR